MKVTSKRAGSNKCNRQRHNPLEDRRCKFFIGGLPSNVDEDMLFHYFSQFGKIEKISIIKDKKKGYSKGYGFVTCAKIGTKVAIKNKSHYFYGRKADISEPTTKEQSRALKFQLYNKKIYIPNMDLRISSHDLKVYFCKFGQVVKVYTVEDVTKTMDRKQIGYIEFSTMDERDGVFSTKKFHSIKGFRLECHKYCPPAWQKNFKVKPDQCLQIIDEKKGNREKPKRKTNNGRKETSWFYAVRLTPLNRKNEFLNEQIKLKNVSLTKIPKKSEFFLNNFNAFKKSPFFVSGIDKGSTVYTDKFLKKGESNCSNERRIDIGNYQLRYSVKQKRNCISQL
jgi:RNA recognition motif-containing protein